MSDWIAIIALALFCGFVGSLIGGWLVGRRKSGHKHDWIIATAATYDSITGPRTIPGYRCTTCGMVESRGTIRGTWTVEDLKCCL